MGFLNPYALIAGGVGTAVIAGSLFYQSTQIHHFHKAYDQDEIANGVLRAEIKGMTEAQNKQTGQSEQNVIKVIQGPKEVQSIIKEVQAAPVTDCTLPNYPEEITNAF